MAAITNTFRRVGDWLVGIMRNGVVLAILGAFALGLTIGSARVNNLLTGDASPVWWASWLQNFSTELFGAFLTFLLIEVLVEGRRARESETTQAGLRLQQLVIQMRSQDNSLALQAVEELRSHNWLQDGSLHEANLRGANLQSVDLSGADLQEATLGRANLLGARLLAANLEAADLWATNLQGANLGWANLQGASLFEANLHEADVSSALLQGADLRGANLQGAVLSRAGFDGTTILPDGIHWTPDTDMARFTDPNHPHFWPAPAYKRPADTDEAKS